MDWKLLLIFLSIGILTACQQATVLPTATTAPLPTHTPVPPKGAGFRYSTYGPAYNPGPDYWPYAGQEIVKRLPGHTPQAIWIVGQINGDNVFLNFPCDTEKEYIYCTGVDMNEPILSQFDELGFQVWLQVEPGNADVSELIHLMLKQYGHHPSVIGVGVDVEWYQSDGSPLGTAVTDEAAAEWLGAAREHGNYRLFLKHWLPEMMPPNLREGLVFIDDSQQFESLGEMVTEFTNWGNHFAPAPVGFQFGYPADKTWWREYDDPVKTMGLAIESAVPNTESLFWVDFTILDVIPPPEQ